MHYEKWRLWERDDCTRQKRNSAWTAFRSWLGSCCWIVRGKLGFDMSQIQAWWQEREKERKAIELQVDWHKERIRRIVVDVTDWLSLMCVCMGKSGKHWKKLLVDLSVRRALVRDERRRWRMEWVRLCLCILLLCVAISIVRKSICCSMAAYNYNLARINACVPTFSSLMQMHYSCPCLIAQ